MESGEAMDAFSSLVPEKFPGKEGDDAMKGTITKNKLKNGRFSWGYVFDAGHDENGKRRQVVRKGFEHMKEAEDALRQALTDQKNSSMVAKDPRTFGPFFEGWLLRHGAGNWGKMTVEANARRAAYAIRMFGDVPLQKLSSMRIEQDLGILLTRGGEKPRNIRKAGRCLGRLSAKSPRWSIRRSTRP